MIELLKQLCATLAVCPCELHRLVCSIVRLQQNSGSVKADLYQLGAYLE